MPKVRNIHFIFKFSIIGVLSILLFSNELIAQKKFKKIRRNKPGITEVADDYYNNGEYFEAIVHYKKALFYNQKDPYINFRIGDCNMHFFKYEESEEWYEKAVKLGINHEVHTAEYWLASMQKSNGKYEEAKQTFNMFIKNFKPKEKEDVKYINQAKFEIEGCEVAIKELASVQKDYSFMLLPPPLNSAFSDYAPLIYQHDSSIVLTSSRVGAHDHRNTVTGEGHSKEYRYEKKGDKWEELDDRDNFHNVKSKRNDGAGYFNQEKTKFYFTNCDDPNGNCVIYVTKILNGKWQKSERLNEFINKPGTWNGQPSLNEKGDTMFFVSKRQGGFGMHDIWYSVNHHHHDDNWTEPKNMGPEINTPFIEMSPHFFHSQRTLFFASNGRPGFGGLDIYIAKGENYSDIRNMGLPFNSARDDFYFNYGTHRGYLASNRTGGNGNDDIYSFHVNSKESVIAYLDLVVETLDSAVSNALNITPELLSQNKKELALADSQEGGAITTSSSNNFQNIKNIKKPLLSNQTIKSPKLEDKISFPNPDNDSKLSNLAGVNNNPVIKDNTPVTPSDKLNTNTKSNNFIAENKEKSSPIKTETSSNISSSPVVSTSTKEVNTPNSNNSQPINKVNSDLSLSKVDQPTKTTSNTNNAIISTPITKESTSTPLSSVNTNLSSTKESQPTNTISNSTSTNPVIATSIAKEPISTPVNTSNTNLSSSKEFQSAKAISNSTSTNLAIASPITKEPITNPSNSANTNLSSTKESQPTNIASNTSNTLPKNNISLDKESNTSTSSTKTNSTLNNNLNVSDQTKNSEIPKEKASENAPVLGNVDLTEKNQESVPTNKANSVSISGKLVNAKDNSPAQNVPNVLAEKDGTIIKKSKTNQEGEFRYENIASNKNYKILLDEKGSSATKEKEFLVKDVKVKGSIKMPSKVSFENIYFDFSKEEIRPEASKVLDELFEYWKANPKVQIELDCFTDATGPDAFNRALSERRGEAAINYLVNKGVDRSSILISAQGEGKFIANNENQIGRQLNRRLEFSIVGGVDHQSNTMTYILEPKNTLYSLAKEYGMTIEEIKYLNGLNDENIQAFRPIRVKKSNPNDNIIAQASLENSQNYAENTSNLESLPDGFMYYTVEPQNTLFSIAKLHNMAVDEVREINNLGNTLIFIGQKLKVKKP